MIVPILQMRKVGLRVHGICSRIKDSPLAPSGSTSCHFSWHSSSKSDCIFYGIVFFFTVFGSCYVVRGLLHKEQF